MYMNMYICIYIYVHTHVYIPIYVYTYTYTHRNTFWNQPTAKLTLYIHMYIIIYSTIKSLRNSQQSAHYEMYHVKWVHILFHPHSSHFQDFSSWGFLTNELTAKFSTKNSLRNILCKMTTELTSERFFKEVVFGSCSDDTWWYRRWNVKNTPIYAYPARHYESWIMYKYVRASLIDWPFGSQYLIGTKHFCPIILI